jgi:hypothetical protein
MVSSMNYIHPNAHEVAVKYLGRNAPLIQLGWGIDGVVYRSPREPAAVKIHTRPGSYFSELAAYQRLAEFRVTEFLGFAIPKLLRHHDELQVIEISVVTAPFLLDFAATTLDFPRELTEEAEETWWNELREKFGTDFGLAQDVYYGLAEKFGIYYYDLKPGNLTIRR